MRLSWPMPRRTSLMSAPVSSQKLANSLMKLIFVASRQLAAYLVISALSGDMVRQRLVGPQVGLIEVPQDLEDRFPAGADDDAVGFHEIVDGRPFLEELRVAGHVAVAAGQLAQPRGDRRVGPHRRRALDHDDGVAARVGRDLGRPPSTAQSDRPSRRRPAECRRPERPAWPRP